MRKLEHPDVILRRNDFKRNEYQQYINRSAQVLFEGQHIAVSTTGKIELSETEKDAISRLRSIAASMQESPSLVSSDLEAVTKFSINPASEVKHNPEALVIVGILGNSIAEIAGTTFQVEKFKKLSKVVGRTLSAIETSDRERVMQGTVAISREVSETEKYRQRLEGKMDEKSDKNKKRFLSKMLNFGRDAVM